MIKNVIIRESSLSENGRPAILEFNKKGGVQICTPPEIEF